MSETNTTPIPAKKPSNIARNILLVLVALLVGGSAIYYFVSSYTKSEGEQAGMLITFSSKGMVFKTYEGELNKGALGNVPGTAQFNDLFKFSVREDSVAKVLMELNGKKVSLHYREVVNSFSWQGETNIWVDGVTVIE